MGRIFYIMGKSATGKDTVYKEILKRFPERIRLINAESDIGGVLDAVLIEVLNHLNTNK